MVDPIGIEFNKKIILINLKIVQINLLLMAFFGIYQYNTHQF